MKTRFFSGLLCLAMIACLSTFVIATENSIIVGTITGDNQIVNNEGQAFLIKQNKQGEGIIRFVGQKAQVKGTVLETDGKKTIKIISYELIEEKK